MSEEKYVSAEEHHVMRGAGHGHTNRPVTVQPRTIVLVIIAVVLCGVSFAGGIAYQKHHGGKASANSVASANGFGRRGNGQRRGSFGQVTTISANSITVQNQRTGGTNTYSITSSTTILDSGQTVAATDIKTGDTVIVMPASTGSTTAGRIMVNPSFGGQQGQSDGDPAQNN